MVTKQNKRGTKKAAKKTVTKKSAAKKSPAKKKTVTKKASSKTAKKKAGKKAASRTAAKTPVAANKAQRSTKTAKPSRKTPQKSAAGTKKSKRPALAIATQHVDFLSYKVEQLRKFYGEILELPTQTTDVDGLSYVVVKTSGSSTLGFMPPHPDMRGERPIPREPTLYFVVRDVDDAYRHLSEKGVAFMGPPEEMPWGFRVLTTTDPEGRTIMLASKMSAKG